MQSRVEEGGSELTGKIQEAYDRAVYLEKMREMEEKKRIIAFRNSEQI